ncbi:reverse transcriptase family protein [Elysia marginata]|uniref:Reverse transcriptase family protein n=1 Tax=Elysia marginata TaxID=1093978 RepID=A0AAV4FR59_9GAST|nr:reverse transcriptase family protein [Elysia marginata]
MPRPDKFEETIESFTNYKERLDAHFVANSISDVKKSACLLSALGAKVYGTLRSLTAPALPSTKSYEELCAILTSHFFSKPLEIKGRFRFHKKNQDSSESVPNFITTIKRLSEHCNFGANLNTALRDRFVCGLKDVNIRKRLLQKQNLTFDTATNLALSMETAQHDAVEMQGEALTSHSQSAHSVSGLKQKNKVPSKIFPLVHHVSRLIMAEKGSNAIFGRDWLSQVKIHWEGLHQQIHKVGLDAESNTATLKEKFKDLFSDGIGKVKSVSASLEVNSDAKPKFFKARAVPFAIKPKVGKALKDLERQGILNKVSHSDWATPIVPVLKKSGDVRVCGDFKVTFNPVLKAEHYTLPRLNDMMASLDQGKKFSKIDLRQAYFQLPLTDKSKTLPLLTLAKDCMSLKD